MSEKFFLCECGTDAIQITDMLEDDNIICLSFWRWGKEGSVRDILRHIWNVIRTGHPYADEIVMSRAEAMEFIETMGKMLCATDTEDKLDSFRYSELDEVERECDGH